MGRRFAPLREALQHTGLMMHDAPSGEHDASPMAMTLHAGYGTPARRGTRIGEYAFGAWRIDPVQTILAAGRLTQQADATPFFGSRNRCRLCHVINPPEQAAARRFPHVRTLEHARRVFEALTRVLHPNPVLLKVSEHFLSGFPRLGVTREPGR